ncbi:MAG: hypothetical protein P8Z49_03565 [Acidobacteriota bacterium]|jgi:DUF4097 and DUF4098 domain-containing protein YvlB
MKRRTFTGILAVAVFAAGLAACSPSRAASVTERVEKTFTMQKGGSLSVSNVNGGITLKSWDKNEVQIVAIKRAKASSEDQAKKVLSEIKLRFDASGNAVSVDTTLPKDSFFSFSWLTGGDSKSVTYTINAPSSIHVKLESVNGGIQVDSPGSEIQAETVNGKIGITRGGLLSATTVNGAIAFDVDNVRKVETTNGSVHGTIRSLKPSRASLETVNGSLRVAVNKSAAFHLDAENVNGSIDCGFPSMSGSRHSLGGEVNGGGETLHMEAVNGSIAVHPAS